MSTPSDIHPLDQDAAYAHAMSLPEGRAAYRVLRAAVANVGSVAAIEILVADGAIETLGELRQWEALAAHAVRHLAAAN